MISIMSRRREITVTAGLLYDSIIKLSIKLIEMTIIDVVIIINHSAAQKTYSFFLFITTIDWVIRK